MNKKELQTIRNKNWRRYHNPGCGAYMPRKQNAIFFSISNGKAHEMKKAEVAYELLKEGKMFITEAVSNKDNRRVDVVDLDTGQEIEVVDQCLTDKTKEAIQKGDVDIKVVYTDNSKLGGDKNENIN